MSRRIRVPIDAELLAQALHLPREVAIVDARPVLHASGWLTVELTLWSSSFPEADGEPPEVVPVIHDRPRTFAWDFAGVKLEREVLR